MTGGSTTRLPGAYWRLWSAAGVSNLGDGIFAVALPLLAAQTTDSPLSIGLIAAFFTIPWLLFALPAGVIIDRSDRRRVLVIADLCRGLLVGGLALVAAFGDVQMWMLWVLGFGLGLGEVFFDNSSQAILPAVVAADDLERANGYFYATEVATSTFIGMPIGSALFGFLVWLPFGLDAASFVVAALLATTLRGSFRTAPHSLDQQDGGTSMRREMADGLRWLFHNRLVRKLALSGAAMNLAFAATQATFVLFATKELGISDRLFGPLLAIVGAGSLLAGLVGGRLVGWIGRRPAMLIASSAPVLTSLATGLLPVTWWVVAMTTVQALMTTIWSIVAVSLRQQVVPDHLFGRVNSVYRWVCMGAMPVGALLGALSADRFGLRAPYFVAAAVLLLALLFTSRISTALIDDATAKAVEAPLPVLDETPVSLDRDPFDDLL